MQICSTDIYLNNRGLIDSDDGSFAALNLHDRWRSRKAAITTCICAGCGFIELYLADLDDVAKIAEKWTRGE